MMKPKSHRSLWALFALLASTVLGVAAPAVPAPKPQVQSQAQVALVARNVIFMIPDGMGPAYATLTRLFAGRELAFEPYARGLIRTYSANSVVTDSAAAGTAMAAGFKTDNGVVGITPDGKRPPSLLSAARRGGKATGVVVTTTVTDATPAVFIAHEIDRNNQADIARQYLGNVDVVLGGGRDLFTLQRDGGQQPTLDLLAQARAQGYQTITRREQLAAARGPKLIGLFAPGNMAYALDRPALNQPRLAEMTDTALRTLSINPNGFFLMVEGSLIDYAGHANDPVALVHETLDFEDAFKSAQAFQQTHPDTLIVIAADHETGGMSIGRNEGGYAANIAALRAAHATSVSVAAALEARFGPITTKHPEPISEETRRADIGKLCQTLLGFTPDAAELQQLDTSLQQDATTAGEKHADALALMIAPMVSRRALIGWTTLYHTGVDIVLYASGPGSQAFTGVMDDTQIPRVISNAMRVNLSAN